MSNAVRDKSAWRLSVDPFLAVNCQTQSLKPNNPIQDYYHHQ
jgi:hypothetical protein